MRIAILTANLGNFDTPIDPVEQFFLDGMELAFHRFTDVDFPPITGLTPRLQYRIPKLFGWEMFPGYDVYIWLDGSCSFERGDCVKWFLEQLGDADMALFKHPVRRNMRQEAEHIEKKLQQGNPYLTPRYKNGLHKEQLAECMADPAFKDKVLYASTAFIYRNNPKVQEAMKSWWYHQSRYFTCDQIALPYVVWKHNLKINLINENQYNIGYLSLVSKHK
jgi:hypothetical protein